MECRGVSRFVGDGDADVPLAAWGRLFTRRNKGRPRVA